METVHRLVGYDRQTERQLLAHDIPEQLLDAAKGIAGVSAEDPDALASYALSIAAAQRIARAIGLRRQLPDLDYFMEPFAVKRAPSMAASGSA